MDKKRTDRKKQIFGRLLKKGISHTVRCMAGTPMSPFFANVYLTEMDKYFEERDVLYFRYSDDIILFADSMKELQERKKVLYQMIEEAGLLVNEEKVAITEQGESWEITGSAMRP